MRYVCKVGGISYDVIYLDYKRKVGVESLPATIRLKVAGSRIPAIGDLVVLTKETSDTVMEKWRGTVNQRRHIPIMEGGIIEIIAYDLGRKITYLETAEEGYSGEKGSTIFSGEASPESTTDIAVGTVDTTDSVLDTVNFGKTISGNRSSLTRADAFKIIQMLSDRDIHIKVDGTADFVNGAGTDRSSTHILQHGINGTLDPALGYIIDETRRVKQVIVKGKGVGVTGNLGVAGSPAADDKVRQFELPFLQSNDTCNKAAANILAELDQEYKYAKFELNDLFSTNYDIYDTVKLKAVLPTITINENLKIYSISVRVTSNGEAFYETVTLELANFRRGVWADLVSPVDAANANKNMISLSGISTQAQENVSITKIEETVTTYAAPVEVADDWEDVDSVTFDERDTSGAFFIIDLSIIPQYKIETTSISTMFFRISDGVNVFPEDSVATTYNALVGKETAKQLTIFIPINTKNKTFTVQAMTETGGKVDLGSFITAYSVAL